jgi:hypothetical protein
MAVRWGKTGGAQPEKNIRVLNSNMRAYTETHKTRKHRIYGPRTFEHWSSSSPVFAQYVHASLFCSESCGSASFIGLGAGRPHVAIFRSMDEEEKRGEDKGAPAFKKKI